MHKKLNGLTAAEVEESRKKHGANSIPEAEPETFWQLFLEGFQDPMIRILCVIAVIMFGMFLVGESDWYEPVGTIIAILLVNFVSARTGVANDRAYRDLKASQKKDTVKARREGVIKVIPADEVVVGDVILLQSGDKILADGILAEGALSVDNSALNGEAEECPKSEAPDGFAIPETITGDTFVDAHSLFRGATVLDGEGYMIVQKVGLDTMMGKMAKDMEDKEPDSPLKVKLNKLAGQISVFGYIGAIIIALAYFIHFVMLAGGLSAYLATGGLSILGDVMNAIAIAITIIVCAVPEGLPLVIALVLMQNTGKLLKVNVLVRKSIGIETAGSLNILFSDKTGTITKGQLEVVEFFDGCGRTTDINTAAAMREALHLSIGKNTGALFDDQHHVVGGNMTDQALLKFLGEDAFHALAARDDCEIGAQQDFNSANKFSQAYLPGQGRTFYKGAPERLLAKAKKCLDTQGNEVDIDENALNQKIDDLANRAMRVLAFGYSREKLVRDEIHDDLVLIGLVGIRDDVRPEAREAIEEVQKAGIQVVMIPGDRRETAMAIAREANLYHGGDELVLTSAELAEMSDDEVKKIIPRIRVISRALPTDKSRMVRLCQEMNLVVGMTGDGVNDSPALKRADVGFAMGGRQESR